MARGRNVRYIDPDGDVWPLHGEDMGTRGVYLTSLAGLYHPATTSISLTPAYKRGAIAGPTKTDVSKIGLKIFTTAGSPAEWEDVESAWWSAWSTDEDGRLEVESLSGGSYRWQPIRLEKWPDDPFDFEPEEEMDWTMPTISFDPGWRGNNVLSTFTGSGSGTINLANPGDLEAWPHFAGDPANGIILPDGIGGASVPLPDMDPEEGEFLVVTDQLEVPIENMADTQIAARLAGLLFQNPVPPGTPTTAVPINGGPVSTTIRMTLEPLYKRPWG